MSFSNKYGNIIIDFRKLLKLNVSFLSATWNGEFTLCNEVQQMLFLKVSSHLVDYLSIYQNQARFHPFCNVPIYIWYFWTCSNCLFWPNFESYLVSKLFMFCVCFILGGPGKVGIEISDMLFSMIVALRNLHKAFYYHYIENLFFDSDHTK